MAEKFLEVNPSSGVMQENEGQQTSSGAVDAGKIPALNDQGQLDPSLLPPGVGPDLKLIEASETFTAGDLVSVFDDAGTIKVRKADATTPGKYVDGFVINPYTAGQMAEVHFEGINNQVIGLTAGVLQFLSTTAGQATDTPPTGTGQVVQQLGKSLSATELNFEPQQPITLFS